MVCQTGFLANQYNGQMVFYYLLYRNTRLATVCFVLMLIHLCESNFQTACPENILNLPLHLQNICLNQDCQCQYFIVSKPQAVLISSQSQRNEYKIGFQGCDPGFAVQMHSSLWMLCKILLNTHSTPDNIWFQQLAQEKTISLCNSL